MPSRHPQPTLETLLERLGGLRSHYQPIVDLTTGRPVGFEALARFGAGVSPASAFERARAAGRLLELEAAAVRAALAEGPAPANRGCPSTSARPRSTTPRCWATCRPTSHGSSSRSPRTTSSPMTR